MRESESDVILKTSFEYLQAVMSEQYYITYDPDVVVKAWNGRVENITAEYEVRLSLSHNTWLLSLINWRDVLFWLDDSVQRN